MASKAENNLRYDHYATLFHEAMNKLDVMKLEYDSFTLTSGVKYQFSVTCCQCHTTFWLNAIDKEQFTVKTV